ncbi:MAG: putative zinc-binding protein [Planctomycetota bacterium]|nr:putative zinc-binding protein [Planctomycetota bacterium]
MSDCCGTPKPSNESSCGCGVESDKVVLLYACSGGANVGEISDKAARELMFKGEGKMFCLAGLGGDIRGMVDTARVADVNLVIDGCPLNCAKKCFDRHGITNYVQIKVTDLDIEKCAERCTDEQVAKVTAAAREKLKDLTEKDRQ